MQDSWSGKLCQEYLLPLLRFPGKSNYVIVFPVRTKIFLLYLNTDIELFQAYSTLRHMVTLQYATVYFSVLDVLKTVGCPNTAQSEDLIFQLGTFQERYIPRKIQSIYCLTLGKLGISFWTEQSRKDNWVLSLLRFFHKEVVEDSPFFNSFWKLNVKMLD